MEIIGKLGNKYTTKISILPGASKNASIKSADQCLRIINNKEILNGLKLSTKIQKR